MCIRDSYIGVTKIDATGNCLVFLYKPTASQHPFFWTFSAANIKVNYSKLYCQLCENWCSNSIECSAISVLLNELLLGFTCSPEQHAVAV